MKARRLIATAVFAVASFAYSTVMAGSDTIKQRLKLQQQQSFLQNQLKSRTASAKAAENIAEFETAAGPETTLGNWEDLHKINAGRHVEANLIYRNFRLIEKIPHAEVISALSKAGYPTDKIVEIR